MTAFGLANRYLSKMRSGIGHSFDIVAIAVIIWITAQIYNAALRLRHQLAPQKSEDLIDIESLPVVASKTPTASVLQDTGPFKFGTWHGNSQLLILGKAVGDGFAVTVPMEKGKSFHLIAFLTKSSDYGIIQTFVDGFPIGGPIDLWSDQVIPSGRLDIGTIISKNSSATVEFRVVGKNDSSTAPYYQFGIDGIKLLEITQ